VGGIPEVIKHNQTGYLVELGDIESAANYAIQLLENDALLERFSQYTFLYAQQRFNSQKIMMQYIDLYDDVMSNKLVYINMLINMLTKSFMAGIEIIEILESHQHQAFFVGGCVRDLLLERPIGDIDIATSASPDKVQQIFNKVIPVGLEHGTVIVRHDHQSFEVTTFRVDGKYTDQRHPDEVEFINTIDKDLERRDFTINALAMDKEGKIVDL